MKSYLRLRLGPRQTERLLHALAYAIDTYPNEDSDDAEERRVVREWQALRDSVIQAAAVQRVLRP